MSIVWKGDVGKNERQKRKGDMKLFIWADPYQVDYGSSMLICVANNLGEAKKLAKTGKCYSFVQYLNEHSSTEVKEVSKLGKPTRILNLPCAEWHDWSE